MVEKRRLKQNFEGYLKLICLLHWEILIFNFRILGYEKTGG